MRQQTDQSLFPESQEKVKDIRRFRNCCMLAFSPIIGAMLAVLVFLFLTSGWLLGWKAIENPPERANKIVEIDGPMIWISSSTGAVYLNQASDTCSQDCWMQVAEITPDHPTQGDLGWSPQTCESPPPILGAVQTKAECKVNYWTDENSIYALRFDGKIYAWHYSAGKEWVLVELLIVALVGAIIVFLVGLVIFLINRSRDRQLS